MDWAIHFKTIIFIQRFPRWFLYIIQTCEVHDAVKYSPRDWAFAPRTFVKINKGIELELQFFAGGCRPRSSHFHWIDHLVRWQNWVNMPETSRNHVFLTVFRLLNMGYMGLVPVHMGSFPVTLVHHAGAAQGCPGRQPAIDPRKEWDSRLCWWALRKTSSRGVLASLN